jgi:hypothetical protein
MKKRFTKMGPKVCLQKQGCCNDQMDLKYAKMWNMHKLTTTKDQGCKANTNKAYTILKWNIRQ